MTEQEGDEGAEDDDRNEILTIDNFLESHYHLFNVLSVFGAIALFLTTVQETQPSAALNIGIVGSLFLFILICIIINIKFIRDFLHVNIEKSSAAGNRFIIHVVFIFLFDAVAVSILVYIASFDEPLLWILAIFILVASAAIVFRLLSFVTKRVPIIPDESKLVVWVIYILASVAFFITAWLLGIDTAITFTSGRDAITTALTAGVISGLYLYAAWYG